MGTITYIAYVLHNLLLPCVLSTITGPRGQQIDTELPTQPAFSEIKCSTITTLQSSTVKRSKMAPPSLKRNIQSFKTTAQKLQVKLDQLRLKKEDIRSSVFTLVEESREEDGRLEEQETYQSDVSALVVTVTDTLIEILELKLEYVQGVLKKLMVLVRENRKIPTPPELMFSRYEDWVGSNQRLFELNSQLYDLEKLKFDIRKRQIQARNAIATGDQLTTGLGKGRTEGRGRGGGVMGGGGDRRKENGKKCLCNFMEVCTYSSSHCLFKSESLFSPFLSPFSHPFSCLPFCLLISSSQPVLF